MSILFLTEMGPSYGIGHFMRCLSVRDALYEYWKESFFIIDMPHTIGSLLDGIPFIRSKWQHNKEHLLSAVCQATDISGAEGVLVDSYHASNGVLAAISSLGIPVFFMDDYQRTEYPKGVIINPAPGASTSLYLPAHGRKVYAGADYMPLRKPFWDAEPLPMAQREGILITLGGSSPQPDLAPIINTLTEITEEKITVVYKGKTEAVKKNILIHKELNSEDMCNALSHARIVVCGGGGTLLEAARLGTPAIAVQIANNQQNNLSSLTKTGFALFAGRAGDHNLTVNIANAYIELNNIKKWRAASAAGIDAVDGQGARRIAQIISSSTQVMHIRETLRSSHIIGNYSLDNFIHCSDDRLAMILECRNTEAVRTSCFNPSVLTQNQHKSFVNSLADSTSAGYWLVSDTTGDIGVISLTGVDNYYSTAELGYYKLTHCDRKGMGRILVSLALEVAFNLLRLKTVGADCMDDNIASYKSMEQAGFTLSKTYKGTIGGKSVQMRRYIAERPQA